MDELKNCPFCGSDDCLMTSIKERSAMELPVNYQTLCLKCGARTSWYSERENAIKNWNMRAYDK